MSLLRWRFEIIQLTEKHGGIVLSVKVVPGSSRDAVAGEYGGGIKLKVTKAPHAGEANHAVVALLAETLEIAQAGIEIIRGHGSPRKEVLIRGLSADLIRDRLKV
jgi:hypothetical protein